MKQGREDGKNRERRRKQRSGKKEGGRQMKDEKSYRGEGGGTLKG